MESEVRGRLEKELDRLLKPEVINMIVKISENLPLQSVEDFCFGYFVGDIIVGTFEESRIRYGREVTPEEMQSLEEAVGLGHHGNLERRRTAQAASL